MPHLNIFCLDEEENAGDDALQQGAKAVEMAWSNTEQWQRIHRQQQHLFADGDDQVPDASLMAFTAVHELIQRETALQKKNGYELTEEEEIPVLNLEEDYFMLDVVEILVVTLYYTLIIACFFLALSLLTHT